MKKKWERNLIKTFFIYLFYIKNVKNSILTMNYIINPLYCIIPSPKKLKNKINHISLIIIRHISSIYYNVFVWGKINEKSFTLFPKI